MAPATTIGDLLVRLGVDASALTMGFDKAERRFERFGTQLFFLGSRVTAGVSLPAAAAVKALSDLGLGFDKAMTESLAIMNNVTPQIKAQMEGVAMDVARTTKFSAQEAAEGYYSLASAGLNAAASMGALPIAARFAQAGVFDLAKSTDYLASAQAAMGGQMDSASQKVADMAKIADVLTEANNMALGTVQDFAEALTNRAGQQLRLFNKTVEEGVAVLAAYATQNIKGKNAGQQLYMMIRDLARASINNAAAWKKAGVAVFDASGNMRNLADILADLEKRMEGATDKQRRMILMSLGMQDRSLAATQSLIGFSQVIKDFEANLKDAAGTTQKVADNQMQALSNQLLQLLHDFQATGIEIFKSFVPTITDYLIPAAKGALEIFRDVGRLVGALPEPVKAAAVAFGALVVAIGPLVAMVGSLTLLASSAMRGFSLLAGGIGAFATTIGQATGATSNMIGLTNQLGYAQQGVVTALGLSGRAIQTVVLDAGQLKKAMNTAEAAAIAGAKAMGMNAIKAAEYGVEARIAVFNANRLAAGQAAATAAMAKAAGTTSLFGRALAFLSNPITLVIGGIGLLGAAWYTYIKQQEAAERRIIEGAEAFRAQIKEIDDSLKAYDRLHEKVLLNTDQTAKLDNATRILAQASGLSTDAFSAEAGKSDELTRALREQNEARKEMMAHISNKMLDDIITNARRADELKKQLAIVETGRGTTTEIIGHDVLTRPMTMDERVAEAGRLRLEIDRLTKSYREATAERDKFLGHTDLNLAPDSKEVLKPGEAERRFQERRKQIEELGRTGQITQQQVKDMLIDLDKAWAQFLKPKGVPGVDDPDSPVNRMRRAIDEMKDALMGTGGKDLKTLKAAWDELMSGSKGAVANNSLAVDNLWQAYSKLRGELGETVPEFERLLSSQIEQANITAQIRAGVNEWGITWSDNAVKFVDSIGDITVAMAGLNGREMSQFFEKNKSTLDELIPYYDELPPLVQSVIDKYQAWNIAVGKNSGELEKNAIAARKAISEFASGVAAKLSDAQTELTLFSKSYADKELAGLRKGLASQERELEKSYKERLIDLTAFADASQKTEFMARLNELIAAKKQGEELLAVERRIGLLRIAQSVGVNARLLRENGRYTDAQLKGLIEYQDALNEMFREFNARIAVIQNLGGFFKELGLDDMGDMLSGMGAGLSTFSRGFEQASQAGASFQEQLAGMIQMATGLAQTLKALADTGSRSMRMLGGAMLGAQIGSMIPGVGTLVGAGIGALLGGLLPDPGWKKLGDDVKKRFNVNISKELAKQIEADAKMLGGHLNAELMHLGEIIEAGGGLNAGNVARFARGIRDVFSGVQTGSMSAANAAKALDNVFADMVEAGTTTNGILSDQVRELVILERQYKTGSKAIKEYVRSQLEIAAGGFNKVVAGLFGPMSFGDAEASLDRIKQLDDQIGEARKKINDLEKEGLKTEQDRLTVQMTRVQLAQLEIQRRREAAKQAEAAAMVEQLAGEQGQATFDRMTRLATAMFSALTAQGMGIFEALAQIGPGLDQLTAAAQAFGFTTNDAFNQLMKLREFAEVHPALVESITGLNELLTGLSNTGYLTAEAFRDIGGAATDTFNDLVANGLTADEAMRAMQPTLQTIWELQQKYGYEVDETTQALLDQAEASHLVGTEYMSANDRMILALDTLNENFEAFLRHLGVDIPREARAAAEALEREFDQVQPNVRVKVDYEYSDVPPEERAHPTEVPGHDVGAIVTRPHVAVVHSNEAIMPIDQLWDQMDKIYGEQSGSAGSVTVIQPGGVQVGVNARYVTSEEQWIAETITRGVIEAIGNNDEPGYQAAITRVVESALKQLGR